MRLTINRANDENEIYNSYDVTPQQVLLELAQGGRLTACSEYKDNIRDYKNVLSTEMMILHFQDGPTIQEFMMCYPIAQYIWLLHPYKNFEKNHRSFVVYIKYLKHEKLVHTEEDKLNQLYDFYGGSPEIFQIIYRRYVRIMTSNHDSNYYEKGSERLDYVIDSVSPQLLVENLEYVYANNNSLPVPEHYDEYVLTNMEWWDWDKNMEKYWFDVNMCK